ncbi:MAG: HAMP domain-containing sensor histidine kinase, partial [Spirulinaceae cyanobacterium]
SQKTEAKATHSVAEFPLLSVDPIAAEQFCLVCTSDFALVIVLGEDSFGTTRFQFSFEPEVVRKAWQILRARLLFANFGKLAYLDSLFEKFAPIPPDYRTVMQFSREILKNLPDITLGETEPQKEIRIQTNQETEAAELINLNKYKTEVKDKRDNSTPELELLQALTHEIRTPLTTIRTMTKLLLKKRKQFSADVIKRLEVIDQECTEQIDRMELIFRAAEMETTTVNSPEVQLTTIYLDQVFQQSIPRWQKQAQRRKVNLEFTLPKKLPKVVSDPGMLDRVLTGLMENFTRSLPTGGEIQVQVTTAGNQLKLQFLSQCHYQNDSLKSLGHLLMFQPETGSLSLNLNVTKNLFHALGGKLIVRQRPQQGEVFTVFLPLSSPSGEGDWGSIQYQALNH